MLASECRASGLLVPKGSAPSPRCVEGNPLPWLCGVSRAFTHHKSGAAQPVRYSATKCGPLAFCWHDSDLSSAAPVRRPKPTGELPGQHRSPEELPCGAHTRMWMFSLIATIPMLCRERSTWIRMPFSKPVQQSHRDGVHLLGPGHQFLPAKRVQFAALAMSE